MTKKADTLCGHRYFPGIGTMMDSSCGVKRLIFPLGVTNYRVTIPKISRLSPSALPLPPPARLASPLTPPA